MGTSGQLSVLIVEDNLDGAETTATLLDIFGHVVRVARNGDEALRLAREWPPEVVILDIGLPGMDGYTVAEKLCETLDRRPLLIAVSGYTNIEAQCREAGINHVYRKPIEPSVLEGLLKLHATAWSGADSKPAEVEPADSLIPKR